MRENFCADKDSPYECSRGQAFLGKHWVLPENCLQNRQYSKQQHIVASAYKLVK